MKKITLIVVSLIAIVFIITVIYTTMNDDKVKPLSHLWTSVDNIVNADIMSGSTGEIHRINTEEAKELYKEVLRIQLNKKIEDTQGWKYSVTFYTEVGYYEIVFNSEKAAYVNKQRHELEPDTAISAWEMTKSLFKKKSEF